jgi:hypothetical protein
MHTAPGAAAGLVLAMNLQRRKPMHVSLAASLSKLHCSSLHTHDGPPALLFTGKSHGELSPPGGGRLNIPAVPRGPAGDRGVDKCCMPELYNL